MVHATFQNSGLPGKISRFRENDMCRINEPECYAGTFLTYTSHVLAIPPPLPCIPRGVLLSCF